MRTPLVQRKNRRQDCHVSRADVADGGVELLVEIRREAEDVFRRALSLSAGESEIDRLESETDWPNFVQIGDRAVVRIDGDIVPRINKTGGIKHGAYEGLTLVRFEMSQGGKLR